MGCVHTHRGMLIIEGWGSPSWIWSVVQKTGEDKCLPLGQNMINFEHNRRQMSCQKTCWKGYDGANILRWNFEVEPFVVQWVVQMEEDTHKLGVIEDVVGKEMCCCQLVLRL